jgi:6,7-dimethyl-8-ribityllumazine synthase
MTAPAERTGLTVPAGCEAVPAGALGPEARVAVIASDYHADIVQRLLDGAIEELEERGIPRDRVTVALTPGAFELGLAARRLAESGRYDAIVVLGCVIRGGTPHFEFVCAEAARGVTLAQQATGVPIGFGVLTCENHQQAVERAGGGEGNKGREAAAAAAGLAAMLQAVPQ